MGNWNITICGTGAHHNTDNPTDANAMADKFAQDLLKAGHTIQSATFTYGAAQLLPTHLPPAPDPTAPKADQPDPPVAPEGPGTS